jgi:hypothetical protein
VPLTPTPRMLAPLVPLMPVLRRHPVPGSWMAFGDSPGRSFCRRRRWGRGRQALGHDLKKVIELGQLVLGQERKHPSHGTLPGALDLRQQASALVAEPAVDDAPVILAVDPHRQSAALHSIDELGGSGGGNPEHVGELPDRDGPRLAEHEEEPQLTERQVVGGPSRRPTRHQPAKGPDMSHYILERYGIP